MKYCTKCGKQLNDDDLFCPACGAKQEAVKPQQEAPKEEHRFNFEEARQEMADNQKPAQEAKPIVKQENKQPEAPAEDKSLSALNSVIMMVGYTVIFIVYLILNAKVFNEDAMIGKIGFLLATVMFTVSFIIRLVKSKNRHNQFLTILHISFIAIMAAFIVGNIIVLANS